jgi:UDP-N-acetylglucosamine diphosphorylase/glucosamine-1-phosphate N-acetyltransferase
MLDWVLMSVSGYPHKAVTLDEGEDYLTRIKPFVDPAYEYTVVLYTDTPLITKKTVEDALNLAYTSNRTVLKMTRGFIFKTDYLLSAAKIYTDTPFYFEEEDFVTAFNFKQVGLIADILKNRILNYHMENGVHFEDLNTAFIGCDVKLGRGVTIGPGNIIRGKTVIKDNVRIHTGCVIEDCVIDEGASIDSSRLFHSYIGKGTTVGPFANLRADNVIGDRVKLGDFVELKNCRIGNGCKLSHLTYAGDVVMGENCNVGAGVVFANYDGKSKHATVVGNNVFVGSSSTLVAPVRLGDGAFVAAGSVINDDLPAGALGIGRARQVVKEGWKNNRYSPPPPEKPRE